MCVYKIYNIYFIYYITFMKYNMSYDTDNYAKYCHMHYMEPKLRS